MKLARITTLTLLVVMLGMFFTRETLAGTTATGTVTGFAREVSMTEAVYTMLANAVTRQLNVARTSSQDFFLDVTLGSGVEFAATPAAGDVTLSIPEGGAATSLSSVLINSDTSVRFFVDITTDFTGSPTFTVTTTGWSLRDVNNTLGLGGTVQMTVKTRESTTGNEFDSGVDTIDWLSGEFGVAVDPAFVSTTAVIDSATNQTFVPTFPDTTFTDNGATMGLEDGVADTFNLDGAAYGLLAGDRIDIVVTGDLTGVDSITWDPAVAQIVDPVTEEEVTAGSTTLSLAGDDATLDGKVKGIRITVDGTTVLNVRTLNISVDLFLSNGASGPKANNRTLVSTTTLTIWTLLGEDTVPPETTITGGPSGNITQTSATFTFTGSDNVTPDEDLVYASRLDPLEPSFETFSSSTSRVFSGLAPGSYTFIC